ncbi:peptidoglycan-binding domain-containing protein [Ensifer canadensis]
MHVQSALNQLGYVAGVPDGHIGPDTTAAISAFQTGRGIDRRWQADAGADGGHLQEGGPRRSPPTG